MRRNAYQRRVFGQQPRYADERGYGPRRQLTPPRVSIVPSNCPRCRGCLINDYGGVRCINCGHVMLLSVTEVGR